MTTHTRPTPRHRLTLAIALALCTSVAGATTIISFQTPAAPDQEPAMTATTPTQPWAAMLVDGQVQVAPILQIEQDDTAPLARASAPLPDYGRAGQTPSEGIAGRIEIRLQQGHFDPLTEASPVLPALAGMTRSQANHDYRLVQFIGPIRSQWQDELAARGLEIIDYVPDFAYIVRGTPAQFATLDELPHLRWSGVLLPAHRLAQTLVPAAVQPMAHQTGEYLVRGFRGEPTATLKQAITATGARILEQGMDSGGGVISRISASESALLDLASIRAVAWIEPAPQWRLMNNVARSDMILMKDYVEQVHGYYGAGQIAAVIDTGLSTGNGANVHGDFAGRFLAAAVGGTCNHAADVNGHGTHVAGSVLGSGVRSGSNPNTGQYSGTGAGIAPRAGLVVWSVCDDFSHLPDVSIYADLWQTLYNYNAKLRVSNNSWGSSNPDDHGKYNILSRETDRFLRDKSDMIAVFAAGNDGVDADWDGVNDMVTSSPPSTSKNVISVGMAENYRASGGFNPGGPCAYWGECWPDNFPMLPIAGDRISDNPYGMSAISGRGPTLSGRLKPDIVAPGSNILSTRSEMAPAESGWGAPYNAYYLFMGGTSMASPLVAGGAVIIREFFTRAVNYPNPSSALVKATLINQAVDMSPGQYGTGPQQEIWRRPDINQGWGRMNLAYATTFEQVRQPIYYDYYPGLTTNQTNTSTVRVRAGGSRLRVTLVWTDAPGLEATHGALVNDLDLEVVAPNGAVYRGFSGNTAVSVDHGNNVEEVDIANAMAGSWTLRVRGYNVPSGPQPYAMVAMGDFVNPAIFSNGFE